eukprot:Nitzschia sp. Nitz4//scaffold30_size153850//38645//39748//NITZ4_002767-RA/size153850-processed-gene-0.6-mRNA-1//1//CDS//3329547229//1451//frame0
MPSVTDELAALRAQSLTKNHASKLQTAAGLSTPEQEESALRESKSKTRSAAYSKDAVENLKAGSKAVDKDLDFKVQQIARKKEDQQKQRDADRINKAGTKAVDQDLDFKVQQINKKKEDLEQKKQAAQNLQSFNEAKLQSASTSKTSVTTNAAPAKDEPTDVSGDAATEEQPKEGLAEATEAVDQQPVAVEEVDESEDIPQLQEDAETPATTMPPVNMPADMPHVPNRNEKKARKIMERMGLKAVSGIARVTLKMRNNQGFFTINQPDVFEKNGSYVVFGEARQGSGFPGLRDQQAQAAKQLATPVVEEKKDESDTPQVEEVVDESGVDAKDIELVVSQAGCSRARAVKALQDNEGDLVNAIMSLTA